MGRPAPKFRGEFPEIDTNAPAAGGGPGYFRAPRTFERSGSPPTAAPRLRGPNLRYVAQAGAGVKTSKAKPPPKTIPSKSSVKIEKTKDVDIAIHVQVLGDGKDGSLGNAAHTAFNFSAVQWKTPGYSVAIQAGKKTITKLAKAFEFKGTISIQTKYGPTAKPNDQSLYGRGTTSKDKKDGNTTLGFHEHCHRQDYLQYLNDKALPTFTGKVGMTEDDYKKAIGKFDTDYKKYIADMEDHSKKTTDEVGYTLSKCKTDGKCPR